MNTNAVTREETETLPAEWFDADGFFVEPNRWDHELAERIARSEGIPTLTAKHWEVIDHVRGNFSATGSLPVMRLVCRATGLDRHKVHKLFGSCLSLWRVAGLPNPGEEAKSYMG
ncbi:MAG: TusE/DsrC/DsvC family sulfur relay protein [Gammaproteobacteria bacterium]|nr:TusE/DsrC/DsvC family sulfur relay protein [Gammaproteobacteria bacterium]